MRSVSLVLALLTLFLFPTAAQPPQPSDTYPALRQQAEASYAEKSFSRAREIYEKAGRLDLQPAEKRWVEFRLADTLWRMDAANPGADSTRRDEARLALEALIRVAGEDHDRIWAEANESLGDSFWTHPSERNFGAARPRSRSVGACSRLRLISR